MAYAVECINVTKKFKKTLALDNVNLTIEENKIYGLLGRNGAGKTTLLNLLSAQSLQSSGTIAILGEQPYENSKVLSQMCFVKEAENYLDMLKIHEILDISSKFYDKWDNNFALKLLKEFNLTSNKKYSALSKGMQSILGIVIGLSSRAPITLYDEPYLGLDAASRYTFYDILLKDYTENPRTIILSTHLIDEVSKIFEHIIILDKGKVLLTEEVDNLKSKAFYLSGRKEILKDTLKGKNVINFEQAGFSASAAIYDNLALEEIRKLQLEGIEIKPVPLQDFFVYMTSMSNRGDFYE